ncbi:MAG: hypothetical protein Q9Q13_10430 [Acidobacteriota bacterium]|nr:hypothetical protein [Acidobacteriota bacterium]
MSREGSGLRPALRLLLFVALYALLANARSVQPNPFVPGTLISVAVIVPVAAGLVCGPGVGLGTGVLAALLTALLLAVRQALGLPPAGVGHDAYQELLFALPHGVMGYLAGFFQRHWPPPLPAAALGAGHLLDLAALTLTGRVAAGAWSSSALWKGVAWETFIGMALVTAAVGLFRLGFERRVST